jgi:hypothetical protein
MATLAMPRRFCLRPAFSGRKNRFRKAFAFDFFIYTDFHDDDILTAGNVAGFASDYLEFS